MYSIIIYFLVFRSTAVFGEYTIFWKNTLSYSWFIFEVNNHFFLENELSIKPLVTGSSNDMKTIFSVFYYQKHLFFFRFLWDTLEWK